MGNDVYDQSTNINGIEINYNEAFAAKIRVMILKGKSQNS